MYLKKSIVLLVVSSILKQVNLTRILCVFPLPLYSHQIVFREYTKELANKGHELVIITTDPYLPKDRPIDNVTEIDVKFSYKSVIEAVAKFELRDSMIRGVSLEMDNYNAEILTALTEAILIAQLNHPPVKQILEDPTQHFDLLIIESYYEYALILTKIFKAPTILISSHYGTPENYETIGAVSRHPVFYPNNFRSNFDSSGIWSKVKAIYKEFVFFNIDKVLKYNLNDKLKTNYGPDAPTLNELKNNVDMLFINSHPMYDGNRPVPPNVIYLGSLHLQPVRELPKDLATYLSNSKNGVVYVSLGTNIKTKAMDKELLEAFTNAFKSLPYDVLWKFDGEITEELKNLKIQQWLPQRDLLNHPNIKLFVTQAGRQSLDEAIDAGVPMVAIPAISDQWYNARKSEEFGICITVEIKTMTADILSDAMLNVINNKGFRNNVKKLRALINDQPEKPIDRAIWWTEYILRHGGAKHLRSPLANISWSEYLMLDTIVAVAATVFAIITILVLNICCYVKIFKRNIKYNGKKTA